MKKSNKITSIIAMGILCASASSCSPKVEYNTVTFDANGGHFLDGSDTMTVKIKNGGRIAKPENPLREGYTFDLWSFADEPWSFAGYVVTNDITLVADWKINTYTVNLINYDPSRGNIVGGGDFTFGSSVTVTANPYDGYYFDGWFDNDELFSSEKIYTFSMPGRNLDLVAKWSLKEDHEPQKTRLIIGHFPTSITAAMTEFEKEFEAKFADVSFEPGKKGVDIICRNNESFMSEKDDIYFGSSQGLQINQLDQLMDITNIVQEKLEGETRSIEDKMSEDQKKAMKYDGKYYAIPYLTSYSGLTFDADLFESKKFYFAATPTGTTLDGKFIRYGTDRKSAGPDGVMGTYDDGLPATYAEFYDLCEYMIKKNCTPMIANGQYHAYINYLEEQLTAKIEGKEQMDIANNYQGILTNLGTVDLDGNKTKLGPTTITPATGYEAYRMLGKYDAIKWFETCYKNKYFYNKIDSYSYNHMDAQNDFLRSSITGASNLNPVGMISEGSWWVNEASYTFDWLSDEYGEEWKAANRNLQFMPLPHANDSTRKENTLIDFVGYGIFVNKNVAEWKIPLISEFIKFINTDESLQKHSVLENQMIALDYEISDENLAKMTSFGKSLYNLQKTSKIVYTYFKESSYFDHYSSVRGSLVSSVIQAMRSNVSAEEYFTGLYNYHKENWNY